MTGGEDKTNRPPSEQLSDEEYQKRLKEAKEKFEYNFVEFKRKKFLEAPCVRSTFLTSIPSSLVIGLVSYLATSRVRLSSHLAVGSFMLVTGGYFFTCRRQFDQMLQQNKELGELMNLIVKYRGTELEEQFQKKYNEKVEEMDKKAKYV